MSGKLLILLAALSMFFIGACAAAEKHKEKEGLHGYGYHGTLNSGGKCPGTSPYNRG